MANHSRPYPPERCDAETMAYLLDLGMSTFRSYVARGDLPAGKSLNGVVRWHRERTLEAFDGRASTIGTQSKPANENFDPIMADILSNGTQTTPRRRSPATHA